MLHSRSSSLNAKRSLFLPIVLLSGRGVVLEEAPFVDRVPAHAQEYRYLHHRVRARIGTGTLTYGHPADSTAMCLLLSERQTLHLSVAGFGGDGARPVAIVTARCSSLPRSARAVKRAGPRLALMLRSPARFASHPLFICCRPRPAGSQDMPRDAGRNPPTGSAPFGTPPWPPGAHRRRRRRAAA